MKANHNLKRRSLCQPFSKYAANNDENDMRFDNIIPQIQILPPNTAKDKPQISKIRKQYIQKIKQMQLEHTLQLNRITEKFKEEKQKLQQHFQHQINKKDQYILLLEEINAKFDPQNTLNNKQFIQQSTKIHSGAPINPLPYQDVSQTIDFKIEPNRQYKQMLFSKTCEIKNIAELHCFSSNQHKRSTSVSKHQLIPKGKPEQTNCIQYKRLPKKQQHYLHYKLIR